MSSTRDLAAEGYDQAEIRRRLSEGRLRRVRRGAFASGPEPKSPEERHRSRVLAGVPQLNDGAVVSHASAAVMHGLPVWGSALDQLHVTRDRRPTLRTQGGQHRSQVRVYPAPLEADEITVVDGLAVTSIARTVVDVGRLLSQDVAISVTDAALRQGVSSEQLDAAVRRATRWPGVRTARRIVAAGSPLAESPGESVSRIRLDEHGIPVPVLQFPVFSEVGRLIGRSDFGWPELRTLGEFDGRIKYGRRFAGDRDVAEIVYAEKLREDALRDLGWQVVRWTWADLFAFDVVVQRLHRAFARTTPSVRRPGHAVGFFSSTAPVR